MTDIITIPLNRLALWKGNLAASIASHGVREGERGKYGRRRSKAVSPSVAR